MTSAVVTVYLLHLDHKNERLTVVKRPNSEVPHRKNSLIQSKDKCGWVKSRR